MELKKHIVVLIAFFILSTGLAAQDQAIKGRVIDAADGKPIEFANLGIMDTFMGDATNEEGHFELKISRDVFDKKVRVSAVGYQTKELEIARLMEADKVVIELVPVIYDLAEVNVEAPSRVLYGMLKMALRQTSNNYQTGPYSAKMTYREKEGPREKTLYLDYTDMSGYSERNWEDAFISRNYIIREGERNYEQSPFEGGMVHVEELLELDYMRHPGNILDSVFHDHFTVVEKEKYVEDGRHILVIGFECSSPQFVFSGDAQIEELNGEIHLIQNDMSIQHFKATYQSAGRFRHGRAFMVDEELKNDSIEYVDYTVETDYGRVHDDRMAVKRIQMDVDRHLLDHAQPETSSYEITFDDLLPGEKNVDENHRHYYDNVSELLDEE